MEEIGLTMRTWIRILAGCLACLLLAGCGGTEHPDVADVRGTVTLDGQPLANASIMFQPTTAGRPSLGTTDDQGNYTLLYLDGVEGAMLGTHKVVIRTEVPGEDGEPPVVREKLLPKYHNRSELTAEVAQGKNTIDFPLSSKK
jgi:hypothetical protein